MRLKMRCDWDGEPPGELMIKATARAWGIAKARSNDLAMVESSNPGRSGVTTPMTPARRTTGTTGMSVRNRRGTSHATASIKRLPKPGSAGVLELAMVSDRQPRAFKSKVDGRRVGTALGHDAKNFDDLPQKHSALPNF